jgi:transposase
MGNGISDESKRLFSRYRFFVFKQRLDYKCSLRGVKLTVLNEYLTSKSCSNCGHIHPNLGKNKKYECVKCNKSFQRDINGARNIYFVSKIEHTDEQLSNQQEIEEEQFEEQVNETIIINLD